MSVFEEQRRAAAAAAGAAGGWLACLGDLSTAWLRWRAAARQGTGQPCRWHGQPCCWQAQLQRARTSRPAMPRRARGVCAALLDGCLDGLCIRCEVRGDGHAQHQPAAHATHAQLQRSVHHGRGPAAAGTAVTQCWARRSRCVWAPASSGLGAAASVLLCVSSVAASLSFCYNPAVS